MSSTLASTEGAVLAVDRLRVEFDTRRGPLRAIDGVSFAVRRGEILGMVGESGAGKSLIGAALTGLMPAGAGIVGGAVRFDGAEIQDLRGEAMRRLRGRRIATIFQDPLTSLNPLYTIGQQIGETISVVLDLPADEANRRAVAWLARVGLPDPQARFHSYPHEFSGGMRQRVVIALALCTEPDLVIADEPTTALDVSVQAQIIRLLRELARERNTALLLITHDMGVIGEITDRIAVLYVGRIVETGPTEKILRDPQHPYTIGLMHSIPRLGTAASRLTQMEGAMPRLSAEPWRACAFKPRCARAIERCGREAPELVPTGATDAACFRAGTSGSAGHGAFVVGSASARAAQGEALSGSPQLAVRDLTCHFHLPRSLLDRLTGANAQSVVRAVDGVSFDIRSARTFALVGESGCGKSTVARLVTGLLAPTAGSVRFNGVSVAPYAGSPQQREALRHVQMVFQDPYSSLDPRWSVGSIIAEPMRARGIKAKSVIEDRVAELLAGVGLSPDDGRRYPHAFSGGQRQRISIARALAGDPALLVCDEPTSALDVSVQAQILNLMKDLQDDRRLTMLFISHDLAVVNFIADLVGVMYLGRLCEISAPRHLFEQPLHPYTRMLRDAVPDLDSIGRARQQVRGDVPSPLSPPPGCRFHTRCPFADERCRTEAPEMRAYLTGFAACHALQEGRIDGPAQGVGFAEPLLSATGSAP